MPGYKSHITAGVIFYLLIIMGLYQYARPSFFSLVEWMLFILAGSLFPDIDVKSKGQNFFYLLLFIAFGVLLAYGCMITVAILAPISLIPMLVRHRGLFHNFWFVVLFPSCVALAISYCIPQCAHAIFIDGFFFIIGAVSHLFLDRGLRRMWR